MPPWFPHKPRILIPSSWHWVYLFPKQWITVQLSSFQFALTVTGDNFPP